MVTIEQVELLESKVSKAIDYVRRITADNERLRETSTRLVSENDMLYGKLDSYQKRIAELEVVLQGFKKDQERIEQGIISALDRLNHFEDAVGNTVTVGDTSGVAVDAGTGDISAAKGGGIEAITAGGESLEADPLRAAPSLNELPPVPPVMPSVPVTTAEIPVAPAFGEAVPSEPFAQEGDTDGEYGGIIVESPESPEPETAGERETNMGGDDEAHGTGEFGEYDDAHGVDEFGDDGDIGEFGNDGEFGKFGENEADNENETDEFLDALKTERPFGLGQAAAAFQQEAVPPSENLLEKPTNDPELDIF